MEVELEVEVEPEQAAPRYDENECQIHDTSRRETQDPDERPKMRRAAEKPPHIEMKRMMNKIRNWYQSAYSRGNEKGLER